MRDFQVCVRKRPNGKMYRSRKPPEAVQFTDEWGNPTHIGVIRCDDRSMSYDMACEEADRIDPDIMFDEGAFYWIRQGIQNGDTCWENDSVRGVPAWIFKVLN